MTHPFQPLTRALLKKFLGCAPEHLQGDWILLGGALLPALGVEQRVTTDIDLVPLHGSNHNTNSSGLALMNLASELGLPVEAVNSAAGFFLSKIKDAELETVILVESKTCRIFRPTFSLYFRLKAARLTESDLSDVVSYAKLFPAEVKTARKTLSTFVDQCLKTEKSPGRSQRLLKLKVLLTD